MSLVTDSHGAALDANIKRAFRTATILPDDNLMTLDIQAVRARFPALGSGYTYADNAGGSQVPYPFHCGSTYNGTHLDAGA
jgi:hypothetical protein